MARKVAKLKGPLVGPNVFTKEMINEQSLLPELTAPSSASSGHAHGGRLESCTSTRRLN